MAEEQKSDPKEKIEDLPKTDTPITTEELDGVVGGMMSRPGTRATELKYTGEEIDDQ